MNILKKYMVLLVHLKRRSPSHYNPPTIAFDIRRGTMLRKGRYFFFHPLCRHRLSPLTDRLTEGQEIPGTKNVHTY